MWKGNMVSVLLPNKVSYPASKHIQRKRSHITLYGIDFYLVKTRRFTAGFGSILVTTISQQLRELNTQTLTRPKYLLNPLTFGFNMQRECVQIRIES